MVVNSVIGIYYYLAVAKQVVFREGEESRIKVPASIGFVAAVGAVLILAIGVYPDIFATFFSSS
jgi:NADH:ubiquinone oxidoreductase subunit 2 (subunit N)